MSTAQSSVSVDDDRVRVTSWSFGGRGAATGRHRHALDYVVVPVTGGPFSVRDVDGSVREMVQQAGVPYRGTAGTEHDVVSSSDGVAVFVEVELKD